MVLNLVRITDFPAGAPTTQVSTTHLRTTLTSTTTIEETIAEQAVNVRFYEGIAQPSEAGTSITLQVTKL